MLKVWGSSLKIVNFFMIIVQFLGAKNEVGGSMTTNNSKIVDSAAPSTLQLCYDVKNFKRIADSEGSLLESLMSSLSSALKNIETINRKLDGIDGEEIWRQIRALKDDKSEKEGGLSGTIQHNKPRDCAEIQLACSDPSRLDGSIAQTIYPFGSPSSSSSSAGDQKDWKKVRVRCDFVTEGGGWTIIQRRGGLGPKEEFYREWTAYEEGFGSVGRNYWIGLKVMNALTSFSTQELRIELTDWDNSTAYANYGTFSVTNVTGQYALSVGGYYGDAGDSMEYHNGKKFYTRDKDNKHMCAQTHHGAWWYGNCAASCLNGYYYPNSTVPSDYEGLLWYHWKNRFGYSLKKSEMKIRSLAVF